MALKKATLPTVMLLLVMATAQSLRLVYINRSGNHPGSNLIFLECRDGFDIPVPSPEIWVERSDLPRQLVTTADNQGGRVTIEITQDLEGFYSCSNSGNRSNTLELIGKESRHIKRIISNKLLYCYLVLHSLL